MKVSIIGYGFVGKALAGGLNKNVEVLIRIDLTTVPANILLNITSHLNCRGRKKQLKCDVKEVYKDILGGIESLIAPEPQWKIVDKKEDDPFKRPGWCNLSYKESCVNPFHTPKNDGRDKDGVKSVTENFKEKDEKKKATEKARALAKKLNKEDELEGRGEDDIPMKRDDADEGEVLERKDSDPPKRNKKGGGLTKEEIQKWFEYFDNEINENDDSVMNFSLSLLPKDENETLLKLF